MYYIGVRGFHEDYLIFSKRERLPTLGKSCNGFPSIGKTPPNILHWCEGFLISYLNVNI